MLGIGQIGSAIGRIGATTPNKGGVPTPPAGFALRQTSDGRYVQDNSGNYELVRAA